MDLFRLIQNLKGKWLQQQGQMPAIEDAIAELEAKLKQDPDNLERLANVRSILSGIKEICRCR